MISVTFASTAETSSSTVLEKAQSPELPLDVLEESPPDSAELDKSYSSSSATTTSSSQQSTEDETVGSGEETETESAQDRLSLVLNGQLKLLFKFCPECGNPLNGEFVRFSSLGTCRIVKYVCDSKFNCSGIWYGQDIIQPKLAKGVSKRGVKLYSTNLDVPVAAITTGNTYAALKEFADAIRLDFVSKDSFYSKQRLYILPAIDKIYYEEMNRAIDNTKSYLTQNNYKLVCSGDARYDSVGHSAGICTYTMMDVESEQILLCETMTMADPDATSSNQMERQLFNKCMDKLTIRFPNQIAIFASDDHPGIGADLREKWCKQHGILHQLDLWHYVKNFIEKLRTESARLVARRTLLPWLSSISSHIYYSAMKVSELDVSNEVKAEHLRERIMGILKHICNIHSWPEDTEFSHIHGCSHEPYTKEETEDGLWLEKGSQAHNLLQQKLLDKKFQKNVAFLTEYVFTSRLESLHSLMRKYAEKRLAFTPRGYSGRIKVAALDYQENLVRGEKTMPDGELQYTRYMPRARGGPRETVRVVKEQKTTKFRSKIQDAVRSNVLIQMQSGRSQRKLRKDSVSVSSPEPTVSSSVLC